MKKIGILLLLAAGTLISASCTKEIWYKEILEKAFDSIRGHYVLEQVIWDGPAVDIGGNGTASKDLLEELGEITDKEICPEFTITKPEAEFEEKDLETIYEFQTVLPIQNTHDWSRNDSYLDFCPYLGRFRANGDGTIGFEEIKTQMRTGSDVFKHISGNGNVVRPESKKLEIQMDYAVYDFIQQKMVKAPVIWRFTRVRYI